MSQAAETSAQVRSSRNLWYVRVPLKLVIFTIVTFFVLFPSPSQFATHVRRIAHLEQMIEPDAPQLAVWEADIRQELSSQAESEGRQSRGVGGEDAKAEASIVQKHIQDLVLREVGYEWDWNLWGSADYIPTIEEMFWRASVDPLGLREDCDGRAVLAASLMRRMGYEADLATDLRHVWVVTPEGRWMGPGGEKAYQRDIEGYAVNWAAVLSNTPLSLSYGISVFPFARELIILVTAYILLLHRRMRGSWAAMAALLLVQGLLFMRCGYISPSTEAGQISSWPAYVGLLHIATGVGLMLFASHRARRAAADVERADKAQPSKNPAPIARAGLAES